MLKDGINQNSFKVRLKDLSPSREGNDVLSDQNGTSSSPIVRTNKPFIVHFYRKCNNNATTEPCDHR